MAVTIVRRSADGKFERVSLDDSRVKAIPAQPAPQVSNPDRVFAGNTEFVSSDPNRYFKRKRR